MSIAFPQYIFVYGVVKVGGLLSGGCMGWPGQMVTRRAEAPAKVQGPQPAIAATSAPIAAAHPERAPAAQAGRQPPPPARKIKPGSFVQQPQQHTATVNGPDKERTAKAAKAAVAEVCCTYHVIL
jgi:hypothetical protein